jgi:hypothetical protein
MNQGFIIEDAVKKKRHIAIAIVLALIVFGYIVHRIVVFTRIVSDEKMILQRVVMLARDGNAERFASNIGMIKNINARRPLHGKTITHYIVEVIDDIDVLERALKIIIEHGVDIDEESAIGETPLYYVAERGYGEGCESYIEKYFVLVKYGADPARPNKRGRRPIDYKQLYEGNFNAWEGANM